MDYAKVDNWIYFGCKQNQVGWLAEKIEWWWYNGLQLGRHKIHTYDLSAKKVATLKISRRNWDVRTDPENRDIVLHEVCHVVVNLHEGREVGHSPRWKEAMAKCGCLTKVERSKICATHKSCN